MKTVYSKPSMQEILLESEGMIAASSDKVPVDPNQPGIPAANKREWPWSNNAWENE